jgi:hypothetical protein
VPSATTASHPISETGLGRRCVIVVAIATEPPEQSCRQRRGVSYLTQGVLYIPWKKPR